MQLVKILSSRIDQVVRIIKVLRYGIDDVQESYEAAPYGDDSNPIKDMIAVYSGTSQKGDSVIIGYINKNRLADIGEKRIFSTNSSGDLSTYIWLKNDESMEIGGDTDYMVRYSELESAFNDLQDTVNDLITAFNTHVHATAAVGPPVTPTPIPGVIPVTASTADITGAKIDEIKTL